MMIVDASVLVAQFDEHDAHHQRAQDLLLRSADQPIAASVLTLAETLVAPARAGRLQEARGLLDQLGVQPVPLGADSPLLLGTLRAQTGLRMPDCCVLHAAETAGAQAVATFDRQLARAAQQRGLQTG